MRSTRDTIGSLASKIASDKAQRIKRKEQDKLDSSASSSNESTALSHNVVTIWTTLRGTIGSPLKKTALGKSRVLHVLHGFGIVEPSRFTAGSTLTLPVPKA